MPYCDNESIPFRLTLPPVRMVPTTSVLGCAALASNFTRRSEQAHCFQLLVAWWLGWRVQSNRAVIGFGILYLLLNMLRKQSSQQIWFNGFWGMQWLFVFYIEVVCLSSDIYMILCNVGGLLESSTVLSQVSARPLWAYALMLLLKVLASASWNQTLSLLALWASGKSAGASGDWRRRSGSLANVVQAGILWGMSGQQRAAWRSLMIWTTTLRMKSSLRFPLN